MILIVISHNPILQVNYNVEELQNSSIREFSDITQFLKIP